MVSGCCGEGNSPEPWPGLCGRQRTGLRPPHLFEASIRGDIPLCSLPRSTAWTDLFTLRPRPRPRPGPQNRALARAGACSLLGLRLRGGRERLSFPLTLSHNLSRVTIGQAQRSGVASVALTPWRRESRLSRPSGPPLLPLPPPCPPRAPRWLLKRTGPWTVPGRARPGPAATPRVLPHTGDQLPPKPQPPRKRRSWTGVSARLPEAALRANGKARWARRPAPSACCLAT